MKKTQKEPKLKKKRKINEKKPQKEPKLEQVKMHIMHYSL